MSTAVAAPPTAPARIASLDVLRGVLEEDRPSEVPLRDGCADLVLSFTVFQHIPRATAVHRYLEER